jgi:hypothetical protein
VPERIPIVTSTSKVTIVLGVTFAAFSCTPTQGKEEAANVVRVVTDLRMADNENKRSPLEHLRSLPCKTTEVCETRNACVEAFEHHVRGVELGARLKNRLTQDASPVRPDDDAALLLEMNLEVEEGRKAMPLCEQKVAALRRQHKL